MASNTNLNVEAEKVVSNMEKVVSRFQNIWSPRKEVRGETGNGLAEEQQVEGHSEQGFAEGIGLAFDQKTGTEQPAKGKKIVFFDNLQDFEGIDQGNGYLQAQRDGRCISSRRTLDSN